jgi:hypothetical protein
MALNYGPTIVKNGLVLAVDAADISSYPGSDTTWYDVSGNGINATNGNFQIEAGGNKYSLYSGTQAYTSETSILNTDYHSIIMIVRFKANGTYPNGWSGNWNKFFTYAPAGTDRSPGVWRYPSARLIHWRYSPDNSGCDFGKDSAGNQFDLNKDYFIGVTKNGSTAKTYVNGINTTTQPVSNPKTSGNAPIYFFEDYPSELMEIKNCLIYNRVLTDTEVTQNYNAVQTRLII